MFYLFQRKRKIYLSGESYFHKPHKGLIILKIISIGIVFIHLIFLIELLGEEYRDKKTYLFVLDGSRSMSTPDFLDETRYTGSIRAIEGALQEKKLDGNIGFLRIDESIQYIIPPMRNQELFLTLLKNEYLYRPNGTCDFQVFLNFLESIPKHTHVIFLSDGGDDDEMLAIKNIKDIQAQLLILGVGGEDLAPLPSGRFEMNSVQTKRNSSSLDFLAKTLNGTYRDLDKFSFPIPRNEYTIEHILISCFISFLFALGIPIRK